MVLCLNTTYQNHRYAQFEPFLQNGADVVVWNPTKLGGLAYSQDLSAVLKKLRKNRPNQQIAVQTYCASSDPGIKAVADLNDAHMHLIIDRGYGDIGKLARSFTVFAALPFVQRILKEEFACQGIEKIASVSGRVLYVVPKQVDQVMDCGRGVNLTRELSKVKPGDTVELQEQDHWADWDAGAYDQVLQFLGKIGIVSPQSIPTDSEKFPLKKTPFFAKCCVPYLIKTCV